MAKKFFCFAFAFVCLFFGQAQAQIPFEQFPPLLPGQLPSLHSFFQNNPHDFGRVQFVDSSQIADQMLANAQLKSVRERLKLIDAEFSGAVTNCKTLVNDCPNRYWLLSDAFSDYCNKMNLLQPKIDNCPKPDKYRGDAQGRFVWGYAELKKEAAMVINCLSLFKKGMSNANCAKSFGASEQALAQICKVKGDCKKPSKEER